MNTGIPPINQGVEGPVNIPISDIRVIDNVCWTTVSTTATEPDNQYLGWNQLKRYPTTQLEAIFENPQQVREFYDAWVSIADRGVLDFMVKINYMGVVKYYGIRQITALKESVEPPKIMFNAEILYSEDDIDNEPPVAFDVQTSVERDTQDNFIKLVAQDPEGDRLSYDVVLGTRFGELRGTPPLLIYTPDNGFEGTDCFAYVARDRFNQSNTAVVDINVGQMVIPDHSVTYKIVTNGDCSLRVTGNFFYDDGTGIKKGSGVITPQSTETAPGQWEAYLIIYSYDHVIDRRDAHKITSVDVTWGSRTNYINYCRDFTYLETFTTNGNCVGEYFDSMFENVGKYADFSYTTDIDFSHGISFKRTFAGIKTPTISPINAQNGIYFQEMFMGANVDVIHALTTPNGKYFMNMFKDSTVKCINAVNTIDKINTSGMFDNTVDLVTPDDTTQQDIIDGFDYVNSSPCGIEITSISTSTSTVCEIHEFDETCTNTSVHKVNYINSTGTVNYNWMVSKGTIVSGQGTDEIEVETTSNDDETIIISVGVADDYGTDTASITHTQHRNKTYLILELPKSYSKINLRDFIDNNNPSNNDFVMVINNVVNPSIETGNLDPYTVRLVNNSEIQALYGEPAIDATDATTASKLQFESYGKTLAHGGNGGQGGKGANDTYTYYVDQTEFSWSCGSGYSWAEHDNSTEVTLSWPGIGPSDHTEWLNVNTTSTGPITSPNLSGQFYRASYKQRGCCNVCADVYAITRRTEHQANRIGGKGGKNGLGAAFGVNWSAEHAGQPGGDSTPAGGNKGGRGGDGGTWGANGADGVDGENNPGSGSPGDKAGKAIIGYGNLDIIKDGYIIGDIE